MTGSNGKRQLPSIPHPDHLRKQAKARLAAMRAKAPATRLAEAQGLIAREYGFASWAALQAEVASRVQSPNGQWRKVRRAHVAPLYPERFRQDGLLDDEAVAAERDGRDRLGVAGKMAEKLRVEIGDLP